MSWDGYHICANCHDAYTQGRLCRACAEQEAIDLSEPIVPETEIEPMTDEELFAMFLAWVAKHWEGR